MNNHRFFLYSWIYRIAGGKSRSAPPSPTKYCGVIPSLRTIVSDCPGFSCCQNSHELLVRDVVLEGVPNCEEGMFTKGCEASAREGEEGELGSDALGFLSLIWHIPRRSVKPRVSRMASCASFDSKPAMPSRRTQDRLRSCIA